MIALIANFRIDVANASAFEAAIGELARATLANEPGVRLYQLCRSNAETGVYRLLEMYDDQEALDLHRQTEWFKGARPKIGPLVAETPVLEQLDPIG